MNYRHLITSAALITTATLSCACTSNIHTEFADEILAPGEAVSWTMDAPGFRFRVIGRSDDMVVVRGLNMFPTMVAGVLSEIAALTGDYRIVLAAPPPYDHLPLHVECAPGTQPSPDLAGLVEAAIKAKLGATARVTVLPAGSFPVTEGKTKRVVRDFA